MIVCSFVLSSSVCSLSLLRFHFRLFVLYFFFVFVVFGGEYSSLLVFSGTLHLHFHYFLLFVFRFCQNWVLCLSSKFGINLSSGAVCEVARFHEGSSTVLASVAA